jgi:cytochrome c-type biogenesis protein CcmH
MSALAVFLALSALLLAAVLALVLPPLFGRGEDAAVEPDPALAILREQQAELESEHAAGSLDDNAYIEARDELERRALEEVETSAGTSAPRVEKMEKGWIFALAFGLPLLTFSAYLLLGAPEALSPAARPEAELNVRRMSARAEEIGAYLTKHPDDAAGWEELAFLHVELDDAVSAVTAFARLSALRPDDAGVLVALAGAVAMRDQALNDEVETLLQRALALAPDHPRALVMAGTAAYERKDYATAARHWERLLGQIPPDDAAGGSLRKSIDEARARAGLPALEEAGR